MHEQNGQETVVEKRKHRRVNPLPEVVAAEAVKGQQVSRFKRNMTIGLGAGIPLLSLALSMTGGTLATRGHMLLAVYAFGLMAVVLAVSLPHLAWAIGDITRSDRRNSWCLAVALDLGLVLYEFVHTFAADAGLNWLAYVVTFAVCVASMLLNCWAFFMAPSHGK